MRANVLHRLLFVAVCLLGSVGPVHARGPVPDEIVVSELPREAQTALTLIARRGPFPYERDGVVFGNRERTLPDRPRGYYHEYTVRTPGTRGRGARRIVCGGDPGSTRDCYYSDDHYQTFRRIR